MTRAFTIAVGALAAAAVQLPGAAAAQAPHTHGPGADAGHSHAGAPVNCTTLASPPWTGLPDRDRQQLAAVQRSVAHLSTPEAAREAGFRPVLGNIPGMGVHYVHAGRSRTGIEIDEPDHLLFAPVEGEERLVGAAYAFTDVVATTVPIPFESDLAAWHDHPEFAAGGETLHMLHVWFVPSSHGPFAGLNFWLPFHGAGIQPPNACWLTNDADAERIQHVAFALAVTSPDAAGAGILRRVLETRRQAADRSGEQDRARTEALSALDAAARADDRAAWTAAADRYLATLTPGERLAVDRVLQGLTNAQMSTPEREAAAQGAAGIR